MAKDVEIEPSEPRVAFVVRPQAPGKAARAGIRRLDKAEQRRQAQAAIGMGSGGNDRLVGVTLAFKIGKQEPGQFRSGHRPIA